MTVGWRKSIGMFLFDNWDAGRRDYKLPDGSKVMVDDFGYYFATLVFVATLAFVVEGIPYFRSAYFNHKTSSSNKSVGYAEI